MKKMITVALFIAGTTMSTKAQALKIQGVVDQKNAKVTVILKKIQSQHTQTIGVPTT